MTTKRISPKTKSMILSYVFVFLAGIMQAASLYVFILPYSFSPGGVTGIATAIQYLTDFNSGYMIFAFNIPLLIAAWFFFKKEYVIKTTLSIVLTSVLLIVLPLIFPAPPKSDQSILAAVAGGVLSGVAVGILFKFNGSNGGSEIIGGFIQRKFPEYNIAWFIFIMDVVVVLGTAFVVKTDKALDIVILSIVKMFCTSKVCSALLEGFNAAIKFEVITEHPYDISREIIAEVGRGVTKMTGQGVYSGKEKAVLVCVVRKRQIGAFQRILKKYPETFAYIMNTKEVYGMGFSVPNAIKAQKVAPIPGQNTAPIPNVEMAGDTERQENAAAENNTESAPVCEVACGSGECPPFIKDNE